MHQTPTHPQVQVCSEAVQEALTWSNEQVTVHLHARAELSPTPASRLVQSLDLASAPVSPISPLTLQHLFYPTSHSSSPAPGRSPTLFELLHTASLANTQQISNGPSDLMQSSAVLGAASQPGSPPISLTQTSLHTELSLFDWPAR